MSEQDSEGLYSPLLQDMEGEALSLESCLDLALGDLAPGRRGAGPGGPRVQPDSLHPPRPRSWEKAPSEGDLGVSLSPPCVMWRRARAGVNAQWVREDWLPCDLQGQPQLPSPGSWPTLCPAGAQPWALVGTPSLLSAQSSVRGPPGEQQRVKSDLSPP